MSDKLDIGGGCRLEHTENWGVTLCYKEHQGDSWYSDTETELDINRAKAEEIIAWLRDKFPAPDQEGVVE